MSHTPLDEIWLAICDECRKTISEVAFNCFLKDLKPVSRRNFIETCHLLTQNDEKVFEEEKNKK